MSDKINNFTEDERENIEASVKAGARSIGADEWEGVRHFIADSKWGICRHCESFQHCKTEFGREFAKCGAFGLVLNQNDRMEECTMYEKFGDMSIQDMQAIAYIIEPKRGAGFTEKF